MLQEKLYPNWAKRARKWWNTGIRRIILFWTVVVLTSFLVVFVIATDYINWDRLNHDFLHSNELSRAILASFILVLDITIVMQVCAIICCWSWYFDVNVMKIKTITVKPAYST
jgi:ABC-type Fe3+ transport system permease subunit